MGSNMLLEFLQEQVGAWSAISLVVATMAMVALLHIVQSIITNHWWKL